MWTLPNILTAGRLLAAAAFPLCYALLPEPQASLAALLIFVGAAVTDWLDGWIARAWNQTSALGALMDPIADKALTAVALLALCGLYGASWLVMVPAGLILFREFAVAGLRESLAGRPVNLAVTRLAKWKTAVQMVGIAVLLFAVWAQFSGFNTRCVICAGRPVLSAFDLVGLALLWIAAVLTVVTGWQYFAKGLGVLLEGER